MPRRRGCDHQARSPRAGGPKAGPMTTCASWRDLRGEDEALVEVVLRTVADAQPDQAAEIAHLLVLEGAVEAELEAPEDQCRDHTHGGVEDEGVQIVQGAGGAEAEDEDLVQNILHDQADAGADHYRYHDLEGAMPGTDREFLGAEVRGGRDQGNDCIDDRKPHRMTLAALLLASIGTAEAC